LPEGWDDSWRVACRAEADHDEVEGRFADPVGVCVLQLVQETSHRCPVRFVGLRNMTPPEEGDKQTKEKRNRSEAAHAPTST
jgi:hypothetical protein